MYSSKYLKYKAKYLSLKNTMTGGAKRGEPLHTHTSKCSDPKCDCPNFRLNNIDVCVCGHHSNIHIDLTIEQPRSVFVLYGSGTHIRDPHSSTWIKAQELIDIMLKINIGPILFSSLNDSIGIDIANRAKLVLIMTSTLHGGAPLAAELWEKKIRNHLDGYGKMPFLVFATGGVGWGEVYGFAKRIVRLFKNGENILNKGMLINDNDDTPEMWEETKKEFGDLLSKDSVRARFLNPNTSVSASSELSSEQSDSLPQRLSESPETPFINPNASSELSSEQSDGLPQILSESPETPFINPSASSELYSEQSYGLPQILSESPETPFYSQPNTPETPFLSQLNTPNDYKHSQSFPSSP